jgi:hypothetical protein
MRAQIALEFLIIMGIASLLLVVLLIIGAYRMEDIVDEWRLAAADDVASSIRQELITAKAMQDGYDRYFDLPFTIANKGYIVQMYPTPTATVVGVTVLGHTANARTPFCNGTLQPGRNHIHKENETLWCNI